MYRMYQAFIDEYGQITQIASEYDPYITVTEARNIIAHLQDYINKAKDDEYVSYLNWKHHKKREQEEEEEYRRRRELEKLEKIAPKPPKPCIIYLMIDEFNGFYKIGRTVNLINRLAQLKTANAHISLVSNWNGFEQDEIDLHALFNDKRIGSSEWFRLTFDDLSMINDFFKNRTN